MRYPLVATAAPLAGVCLALTLGLAGCGGSTTSISGTRAGATPGTGSQSGPVPVQETNPPGDIPDTQHFVEAAGPGSGFSVKVPEGWARAESAAAVTFSDHYNSIRLETLAAAAAPTVSSAQRDEATQILHGASNVGDLRVSSVSRAGGSAVLITYAADSRPDPVTGRFARLAVERYEFWHAGSEAIVTLAAPQGSDNVDPWRTVTDSFRWR